MIQPRGYGAAGKVLMTLGAPAVTIGQNGLLYDGGTGAIYRVVGGATVGVQGALCLDSSGRLITVDASAGLPAGTVYQNGLPFSGNALCIDAAGAVLFTTSGYPYTATGALAIQ
jgi:hypothetical protein